MKHILIVSHNYPYEFDHTFGFFCKNQADALVELKQKVGVVCPLAYSMKYLLQKKTFLWGMRNDKKDGVQSLIFFYPSIPKLKGLRYRISRYVGRRLIDMYIKKFGRPDVIHLHVYKAAEAAMYGSRKYDIPLVWTEHFSEIHNNQLNSSEWGLVKELSNACQVRIAVSNNFRIMLERLLNQKFEVIPNVYDSKLFTYSERKKIPGDPFVFIHVAHINENKNQRRLLAAFKLAFSNSPNIKLKIIGAGGRSHEFLHLIDQLKIAPQIETFESLPSTEVCRHLKSADVFVLSSNYETFGVSIIEAMACGLPIVSTCCGGPESILTTSDLGVLTELQPNALADGMTYVYYNINKYSPRQIAKHAYDRYSLEAIGKRLLKIYDECVKS